jgi:tRNA A37 threonylcarbamoyladenosine synthetase subunit TsaC/SUA5/YrdC
MVEEYDPEYMHDNFKKLVDLVVDGGLRNVPSTIVDCTQTSWWY